MSLKNLISPEQRRKKLRTILSKKGFARIIEAHNGLSGLIGKLGMTPVLIWKTEIAWNSTVCGKAVLPIQHRKDIRMLK